MSRCFQFPPPGYEKKIEANEASLLRKEKHKEKKHKKEKEKKEGKEKREKERRKDKHKERKDKNEKHKDRDRHKEKRRTSEEKKAAGVLPEKLVTNTLPNNSNGDSRFVQDLAKRIRDGEAAKGSNCRQKTENLDRRNAGSTGKAVENNKIYPVQETNNWGDEDKRIDPQRNLTVIRNSENDVAHLSFGPDQNREDDIGKAVKKKDQGKETVTKSEKQRDKEGSKKSDSKDNGRNLEREEEKTEVINKVGVERSKFIERELRLKERDKADNLNTMKNKLPDISKAFNKNLTGEGNIGKRKYLEQNGLLYENGSNQPNKLQRPAVESGRKFGTRTELQSAETITPPKLVSELQGSSCRQDVRHQRENGFISCREGRVVSPDSLAATVKVKVNENGKASEKLKCLDQILYIPEREELAQFDDQEWLFDESIVKLKKPRTNSLASLDQTQVWDQAFRIEAADITALPYVFPF